MSRKKNGRKPLFSAEKSWMCSIPLRKTERLLGKENQVSVKLREMANTCEANVSELASTIEGGRAMEDCIAIKQ